MSMDFNISIFICLSLWHLTRVKTIYIYIYINLKDIFTVKLNAVESFLVGCCHLVDMVSTTTCWRARGPFFFPTAPPTSPRHSGKVMPSEGVYNIYRCLTKRSSSKQEEVKCVQTLFYWDALPSSQLHRAAPPTHPHSANIWLVLVVLQMGKTGEKNKYEKAGWDAVAYGTGRGK